MVILKIRYGSECRRVKVENLLNLEELNQMISNMFGIKGEFQLRFSEPVSNAEGFIKDQSDLNRAYSKLTPRSTLYLSVTQEVERDRPHRHRGRHHRGGFPSPNVEPNVDETKTETKAEANTSDVCDAIKEALISALGGGDQPLVAALVEGVAAMAKDVLAKMIPVVGPLVSQWIDHPVVLMALSFLKVSPDAIKQFFGVSAKPAAQPEQPTASVPLRFHRGPSCRRFLVPGAFPIQSDMLRHEAVCDNCRSMIVGVRHKCADCPDYDLCMNCIDEKDKVHDAEHVFKKIGSVELQPVRHHAFCDNCQNRIVGLRFKCANCDDYDLCMACIDFRSSVHDSSHTFNELRGTNPKPNQCRVNTVSFSREPMFVEPEIQEPEVKPDVKPEAKVEIQPEVKSEDKTEVKVNIVKAKPEVKAEVKPEVKAEVKPEVKAETKVKVEKSKTEEEEEQPFRYEKELKMLVGMGFEDTLRARYALMKFHGNLAATVDLLVSQ